MFRRLLLLSLAAFCGSFLLAAAAAAAPPRLVVVVSIDQIPQSYLLRFADNADPNGIFQRVKRKGAAYSECNYRHASTYTGPGHAVLSSGAYPHVSGIIDNSWYDRQQGKVINCVADRSVDIIGSSSSAGASPKNLLTPTLGDAMKLATDGDAKVFSIGIKDRATILSAGRLANGVFWLDTGSGNWVTSTAYSDIIPGYLRQFNEENAVNQFAGLEWNLLLPIESYHQHRPDDDPAETPISGMTKAFPHVMPAADEKSYISHMKTSPFGNGYALTAASAIIQSEGLGADETPDLLCLNLASNDYVGHAFGPYSLEVEDMFYRTDIQLGKFADDLDEHVGEGEWTMAISSDHGVGPSPDYLERLGLLAKEKPLKDLKKVQAILEAQLAARFGELADDEPSYVESVRSSMIYLRERHPNLKGERFVEAQRLVRTVILAHPSVVAAMTRDEIVSGLGRGPVKAKMVRAFHPDRSGDVVFAFAPYQYDSGSSTASHGSPWKYDTHVPLALLGKGVKNMASAKAVDPGMLAPTLAKILQMPAPAAAGDALLIDALEPTP